MPDLTPPTALPLILPHLLRWPGLSAYIGPLQTVGGHTHRATALLLAPDAPIRIRRPGGTWRPCAAAVLPAGFRHELDCGGHVLAVIYLDPLLHGQLDQAPLIADGSEPWARRGRAAVRDFLDTNGRPGANPAAETELHDRLQQDILPVIPRPPAATARHVRLRALGDLLADGAPDLASPEMARELGLSDSHFSHLFSRHAGVSWTAYRNWRRLLDATRILSQSPHAITRIALDAGFSSPAHFAASFRDRFGITPSQLRGLGAQVTRSDNADF